MFYSFIFYCSFIFLCFIFYCSFIVLLFFSFIVLYPETKKWRGSSLIWAGDIFTHLLVFPWQVRNNKSCEPDILHHQATFYWKHPRQMWYSCLAPVSSYWTKLRPGYFQLPHFWSNSLQAHSQVWDNFCYLKSL